MHEWLTRREPRWSSLSILQRLDKETSGVLVFGKTREANRSLARQFETRTVKKTYVLRTDRQPNGLPRLMRSGAGNELAETELALRSREGNVWSLEARPLTGRTHQIRLHARDASVPILGDDRYGGSSSQRLCLHAESVELEHPTLAEPVRFHAPADFETDAQLQLCRRLWPEPETDSWRLVHAKGTTAHGLSIERLGDFLLAQSEGAPTSAEMAELDRLRVGLALRGAYHKRLDRHVRGTDAATSSPVSVAGSVAPDRFEVRENGVRYFASLAEGYSCGLFLDQRDNRRRLLTGHVFPGTVDPLAGKRVLNLFAYTCGFSVVAGLAGASTTSVDLSRKVLDWGRDNFALNGLDPATHEFIYGDCFDWVKRLGKKGRRFDVVLLDPPTFSQSRESGVFRVEKDYGRLAELSLALLEPAGILFCSTNSATLAPEAFVDEIHSAIERTGRMVTDELFVPQPPDFPTGSGAPGYLKTFWLRVA